MTVQLTPLAGRRIAVAGAGVFGLSVALRAAAAGAVVEVFDLAPLADNASGVAAGMIAPAGEAIFDPESRHRFDLFRAAQEGWSELEALAPDLVVDRSGAVFLFAGDAERDGAKALLRAKGCAADALPPSAHADHRAALAVPGEGRVCSAAALAALRSAILASGGVIRRANLDPDRTPADSLVIACGYASRAFIPLAPELEALSPIKGQIVRFAGGPVDGPVIRAAGVYLAPQKGGPRAGATMEAGRDDRTVDAEVIAELRARAMGMMEGLDRLPFEGLAAVRAATPDGLPLAGPSSRPGVFLATGARRNGWLLAPLVSRMVVSYLSGGDGGPYAEAFDPRRFARAYD